MKISFNEHREVAAGLIDPVSASLLDLRGN